MYTKQDFYLYFDHAVNAVSVLKGYLSNKLVILLSPALIFFQYSRIEALAIGPYFYPTPDNDVAGMRWCVERYTSGVIFGFNESYAFDSTTEESCVTIPPEELGPPQNFSSEAWLAGANASISFDSLLEAHLSFVLKTVRFRDLGPFKSPDCFQFDIDVSLGK